MNTTELVLYKSDTGWQWKDEDNNRTVGPIHTTEQEAVNWVNKTLLENEAYPDIEKEIGHY